MSKCPLSFECGIELLVFDSIPTHEFTISNVSEGTLCIYNLFLPPNEELTYEVKVNKQTKGAFIAGIFSNRN